VILSVRTAYTRLSNCRWNDPHIN